MVGDPDAGTLLRYVLRSIACHRPEKFSCFLIYGQSKAQWGGSCTWTNAYQAIGCFGGAEGGVGGFHFRPAMGGAELNTSKRCFFRCGDSLRWIIFSIKSSIGAIRERSDKLQMCRSRRMKNMMSRYSMPDDWYHTSAEFRQGLTKGRRLDISIPVSGREFCTYEQVLILTTAWILLKCLWYRTLFCGLTVALEIRMWLPDLPL